MLLNEGTKKGYKIVQGKKRKKEKKIMLSS